MSPPSSAPGTAITKRKDRPRAWLSLWLPIEDIMATEDYDEFHFPDVSGLFAGLGSRDSNPNFLIQSQTSYR